MDKCFWGTGVNMNVFAHTLKDNSLWLPFNRFEVRLKGNNSLGCKCHLNYQTCKVCCPDSVCNVGSSYNIKTKLFRSSCGNFANIKICLKTKLWCSNHLNNSNIWEPRFFMSSFWMVMGHIIWLTICKSHILCPFIDHCDISCFTTDVV